MSESVRARKRSCARGACRRRHPGSRRLATCNASGPGRTDRERSEHVGSWGSPVTQVSGPSLPCRGIRGEGNAKRDRQKQGHLCERALALHSYSQCPYPTGAPQAVSPQPLPCESGSVDHLPSFCGYCRRQGRCHLRMDAGTAIISRFAMTCVSTLPRETRLESRNIFRSAWKISLVRTHWAAPAPASQSSACARSIGRRGQKYRAGPPPRHGPGLEGRYGGVRPSWSDQSETTYVNIRTMPNLMN